MRAMKQSKYRNKKTTVNGITFDSAKEAARYQELLLLQRAGRIRKLRLQPQFTLIEAYKDAETGETARALKYIADFSYEEPVYEAVDGITATQKEFEYWRPVVEDVKGKKTREYEMKKKLMLNQGIRIKET